MRIAIVGAGIAGNMVAHRLHRDHEITVFEANDYVGGHTNTVEVEFGDRTYAVDTGFIVFNHWTYPRFTRLLDELGVDSQPSGMSFSVQCERTGLEYNGTSIDTLFAQRSNLVSPGFYGMIRDVLRFNRDALAYLENNRDRTDQTLAEFLAEGGYGRKLVEHYVVPMGAAIWSTDPARIVEYPVRSFLEFCENHGLLSINRRPAWRVVTGGSREYVEALVRPFQHRIRLRSAVTAVRRFASHVEIVPSRGETERFDCVFLACHSDQGLAMLADPTPLENEVLGAIAYQANEAVLHTDESLLPRRRRAWAAWNYHIPRDAGRCVAVTYNMNILQGLDAPRQICVSLNCAERIDPSRFIHRFSYHHPLYTQSGIDAQRRHAEIDGAHRTFFCGAYWGSGFHEDGVASALNACRHFENWHGHEELHLRRAS